MDDFKEIHDPSKRPQSEEGERRREKREDRIEKRARAQRDERIEEGQDPPAVKGKIRNLKCYDGTCSGPEWAPDRSYGRTDIGKLQEIALRV